MANVSDYLTVVSTVVDLLAVSDNVVAHAKIINMVILSTLIGLLGVVTNIINAVVFVRLGFKETINISLLALTISDLISSILLIWLTICYNPLLQKADIDIVLLDFEFRFGRLPRAMFLTTTAFITVFITIERYLCIVFPIKVKRMMTTKRVTLIIVAIYVTNIGNKVHNYFTFRFGWKWVPRKNASLFGIVLLENSRRINLADQLLQTFNILACFSIVSIFTALFVWKLNQRSKWRHSLSGAKAETSSVRDKQVIKMVTCVAAIFIVCYIPQIVLLVVMVTSSEISLGNRYENLFRLMVSLTIPLVALNSSVNSFVYYKMMSKYKAVFRSMFCSTGDSSLNKDYTSQ